MAGLQDMNTEQLIKLLINTSIAIKAKIQEEMPGTDAVPMVNELMDEIAGAAGEAANALKGGEEAQTTPEGVGPEVPSTPSGEEKPPM